MQKKRKFIAVTSPNLARQLRRWLTSPGLQQWRGVLPQVVSAAAFARGEPGCRIGRLSLNCRPNGLVPATISNL